MKIAINGTSRGLGNFLANHLNKSSDFEIVKITERLTDYENILRKLHNADVFINNAHSEFQQTILTYKLFEYWRADPTKFIISIGSRAGEDNLSKGYIYSASKASLKQLHSNLTYNSDKSVKMTYLSLGLIESNLPSLSYIDILNVVLFLLDQPQNVEIPYLSVQNSVPYVQVQKEKEYLIKNKLKY